jgi:phage gpG-like protein
MASAARNPIAVFRAMGTTFKSLTEGTFNSAGASYRPSPWPAKKDGSPSNLQKSTTLSKSFHLTVSNRGATLSNPMIYAAIHQFGARGHVAGVEIGRVKTKFSNQAIMSGSKGIPPRPFFPVQNDRLTPMAEFRIRAAGERALAREASRR